MRGTHIFMLLCILCVFPPICAQQTVFDEFREAAGDYAALYSGQLEVSYNKKKYTNHPYWNTDELREGSVCYRGWLYTDLQLRYDTYKKKLILVMPVKQLLFQVDMRKVDYFIMDGQKFVPQGDTFAVLLYESPHIRLTQYIVTAMGTQVQQDEMYYSRFEKKVCFNLHKDGTDYLVTSRSGFLRLFPDYKKQLKSFYRKKRLNFKEPFRVQAMTLLTEYADSLIHK